MKTLTNSKTPAVACKTPQGHHQETTETPPRTKGPPRQHRETTKRAPAFVSSSQLSLTKHGTTALPVKTISRQETPNSVAKNMTKRYPGRFCKFLCTRSCARSPWQDLHRSSCARSFSKHLRRRTCGRDPVRFPSSKSLRHVSVSGTRSLHEVSWQDLRSQYKVSAKDIHTRSLQEISE